MTIFSVKMRVCATCHRALSAEDDVYQPQKYPEVLFCGACGSEFRRWEGMERAHKGKIKFSPITILEPYFDCRKHFYDSKWTKEKIIQEIRTVESEGRIRRCYRENRALYDAAASRFGTWRNAIRAAKTSSSR